MDNFIREVQLLLTQREIGDTESSRKTVALYTWNSDGSRQNLPISFRISKTMTQSPNESTISIKNLNPESRRKLASCTNDLEAYLYVGYQNQTKILLSSGSVIRVLSEREGVENTTTFTFMDGFGGIMMGTLNKSYAPNYLLKPIVTDLANALKSYNNSKGESISTGITVNPQKIEIDTTKQIGSKGFSAHGRSAAMLDNLSREYGFTWSVQNGEFQAISDDEQRHQPSPLFPTHVISYKNKNLFKATPELGSIYQYLTGMRTEALLNPQVKAGDFIQLESEFYPQYNGLYQVFTVDFTGDTWGTDWKMEISSQQPYKERTQAT